MASAQAYRGLVERLERQATGSPGRYKLKVALLAGLGFLVLGGSVLLALGMSVGLVLLLLAISPLLLLKLAKVVWIPIGFGWLVLRALWVTFPPPDGRRLKPGEAPALHAEVERLRRMAGAPKLDGIIIDAELNAAAASVPRAMGLFGHRHYLVLGLPLMQLLDREQFASVIAHEFGHFGGGHGRFSGWIHRVRVSWYRLLAALSEQGGWASRMFVRFFNWYAPYFNAYSFVLARANEYQADAMAARVAGPQVAGQALIRVNIGADRLSRDFWPGLQRASREQPQPPAVLHRDMAMSLRDISDVDAERLSHRLTLVSDLDDTHPTLAQRLQALGVDAGPVPPPQVSAAEALLGDWLPAFEQQFSDDWREGVIAAWEGNHAQHREDARRHAELAQREPLDADEAIEFARLDEIIHPEQDPLPRYEALAQVAAENAFVRFRLGELLLERGNADGEAHLRAVMALDPDAAEPALHRLDAFHQARNDVEARDRIAMELSALYGGRANATRARNELTKSDLLQAHGLAPEQLEALRNTLDRLGSVRKAWLVRKQIKEDPRGPPHHVLLVTWRGLVFDESRRLQQLVDALELPGSFLVFTAPNQRGHARRVRKAAGTASYRKGWW